MKARNLISAAALTIVLLFGCYLPTCFADPLWNTSQIFLEARSLLVKGDTKAARHLLGTVSKSAALEPWCRYYVAQALIIEGRLDKASALLKSFRDNSVLTLAAQMLEAEIALRSAKKFDLQSWPALKSQLKASKFDELMLGADLIEALLKLRDQSQQDAFKSLSAVAKLYPRSIAATKSTKVIENSLNDLLKQEIEAQAKEPSAEESAKKAWQASQYEEAKNALLKIPQDSFIRPYISARIAEEHSDFNHAIKLYDQALEHKADSSEELFHAAFRLGLLLATKADWKDAAKAFQRARLSLAAKDNFEYQSSYYWENLSLRQFDAAVINEPPPYDLRSYYFWLEQGARAALPLDFKPNEDLRALTQKMSCQSTPLPIPRRWSELSQLSLFSYLGAEVRYSVSGETDESVLMRVKILANLGAYAEVFKEFGNRDVFLSVLNRCPKEILASLYPIPYIEIVKSETNASDANPFLIMSLTRTESAFNPLAVSRSGAMGLMQLMPATAKTLGFVPKQLERDPPLSAFIPTTNIQLGTKYVKELLPQFQGRWYQTIASYNAGPVAVERWVKRYPQLPAEIWIELIPYKETREYVKRVLAAYWMYTLITSQ